VEKWAHFVGQNTCSVCSPFGWQIKGLWRVRFLETGR